MQLLGHIHVQERLLSSFFFILFYFFALAVLALHLTCVTSTAASMDKDICHGYSQLTCMAGTLTFCDVN